ncbi:hypothetical protein AVEN_194377-1 [Araneus ventricosus]|uniref:Uncharacterized protein n=1 Tax=Araneus ventricosus TaxID=182803 RepID=A0A4Y2A6R7_ARAVE|nr:hypothetical protein AVEN_194377-1 [Araneus ventricosus]
MGAWTSHLEAADGRLSERELSSPVGLVMVVWLLELISDDGSYPGKTGNRRMSRSIEGGSLCGLARILRHLSLLHRHQNAGHSRIVTSARIGESHLAPGRVYTVDDSFIHKRRTR